MSEDKTHLTCVGMWKQFRTNEVAWLGCTDVARSQWYMPITATYDDIGAY